VSELASGFQSINPNYQQLLRLVQERFNIAVTPLQALTGGRSGASIYLVSVRGQGTGQIEHYILKLDRKNEKARSDETQRHQAVLSLSPPAFVSSHLPRMIYERLEHNGTFAVFYHIAGQSLHQYRPLAAYERQNQIETLFEYIYGWVLDNWNAAREFRQAVHPQALLTEWLGFRLREGGNIEQFLHTTLGVAPDLPGLLIQGSIFPNPLAYARSPDGWQLARLLDVATGLQHGDLNTFNILARFDRQGQAVDGCYLIDFAMFKEQSPLLYDLRYLEISYLILKQARVAFPQLAALVAGEAGWLSAGHAPVEAVGVARVLAAARASFEAWVNARHPSLSDDLWGQYWLAGAAAGLAFVHKAPLADEERLAGLIYAAANLKQYTAMFGLPSPPEGREIFDPARWNQEGPAGPAAVSPGRVRLAPRTPNNLPAETSVFIGREPQVQEVGALLNQASVRLVSLTGPGGVGKTRLALQTASRLLADFPDGVFYAPLADVTGPGLVISKIARLLGVREGGSQPLLDALQDYLHDQRLLLLLDNLEQVTAVAPALVALLSAAPGLKILATSRVLLKVRGEYDFPVPPMRAPAPGEQPDPANLGQNEAVQLFVERARQADPGFSLTDKNAAAVAQICRALDGLPLAIELAAARVRLLSPQAMLARLSNRLALLTGGARDLPARQQTLRASLDWSYSLLDENEQILLACLGLFNGGFTLAAAEAVQPGQVDVLSGVEKLLENSLLRQEAGPVGQTRFYMLDTVREYALGLLDQRGGRAALMRSYALYTIQFVGEEVSNNIYLPESTAWLDGLESEHDNIRAALRWSLESGEFAALAQPVVQMIAYLTWFWYRRGYLSEGRRWAGQILDQPDLAGQPAGLALVLQSSALLAMWQGDLVTAREHCDKALTLIRQVEDTQSLPIITMNTGVVYLNMGRDTAAHPLLEEAQSLTEQIGYVFFYATTLVHLGNVSLGLGRPEEALRWLEIGLATARALGEPWVITFALNNLGEVARVSGDWNTARGYYEESEALLREMGDKGDLARLVHNLGYTAFHQGDEVRAEALFKRSLTLFRQLGNRRGIAECLAGLASLWARRGQAEPAARLLGAAQALLISRGAAWWPADRVEVQRCQAELESALGQPAFQIAWQHGQALTLPQAVSLAGESQPRDR